MNEDGPEPGEYDFWVWDPRQHAYRPRDTAWWSWDSAQQVMRPVEADGWTYDPLACDGRGQWVNVSSTSVIEPAS